MNTAGNDEYRSSADFYDYIPVYEGRSDIDYYVEQAERTDGSVLEIGCGTGRVLIPVAQTGCEITGLDPSSAMLDICKRKLKEEDAEVRERVTLIEGDMQDFNLKCRFSLITTPFRSFQHLETVEDQLRTLENIHHHLDDKGIFILDLFNPSMKYILDESRREEFGDEPPFDLPDGRKVTRKFRNPSVDLAKQLINCEIIYHIEHSDGKKERTVHSFKMRYLFRYEAEHLLERSGFRVLEVLGAFDGSPFASTWPGELIITATLV